MGFWGQRGADGQPRAGVLQAVDLGVGNGQRLVHRQAGVQHHHRRHQLGDRRDRHARVRVFLVQGVAGARVDDQHRVGTEVRRALLERGKMVNWLCCLGERGEGEHASREGGDEFQHPVGLHVTGCRLRMCAILSVKPVAAQPFYRSAATDFRRRRK